MIATVLISGSTQLIRNPIHGRSLHTQSNHSDLQIILQNKSWRSHIHPQLSSSQRWLMNSICSHVRTWCIPCVNHYGSKGLCILFLEKCSFVLHCFGYFLKQFLFQKRNLFPQCALIEQLLCSDSGEGIKYSNLE